jgi:hypothetical protein
MNAIARADPKKYPRGRNCLSSIAALMISMIMGIANIVMILLAIQSIATKAVRNKCSLTIL